MNSPSVIFTVKEDILGLIENFSTKFPGKLGSGLKGCLSQNSRQQWIDQLWI